MYGGPPRPPPGWQPPQGGPNGFPPFSGNLPPGMPPPTLAPQNGMPGNFPPYPPPGFNPNFAPPPQAFRGPPPGNPMMGSPIPPPSFAGSPSGGPPGPGPGGPPPSMGGPSMYPPRGPPRAPGLGYGGSPSGPGGPSSGAPSGSSSNSLPVKPDGASGSPGFVKEVKTTAVFISGIPGGITDGILQGILQTCGPVHRINRVTGPSGKPQAFGFAEFEDPEVVLRCMKCLNGVELPDISPENRGKGLKKKLSVKADEKTKAFLDEYEQSAMRTDEDDANDEAAKKRIHAIVTALNDPSADLASVIPASAAPDVSNEKKQMDPFDVPAHLRDLAPEELPENQRGIVLDTIAMFRDGAAKKEAERRRIEEQREQARLAQMARESQQRAAQTQSQSPGQQPMRQWGAKGSPVTDPQQAATNPLSFVKSSTLEGKGEGERTDEEEEELGQKARRKRLDQELRERERRVEARERQIFDRLGREATMLRTEEDALQRDRASMRKLLANWDDDQKMESGREIFYADRGRWRSARQPARRKEYQEDVRDRQQEADEQAALEKESEEFLKQQMEEMAEEEAKQRAAGYLFSEGVAIKVSAPTTGAAKPEPSAAKTKAIVAFGAEEEDEEKRAKSRKAIIKLDEDEGLTEEEKTSKRVHKLEALRDSIPVDQAGAFGYKIKWDVINDVVMARKIIPFIRSKITDALGELDDDELPNFVIQHVREHAEPTAIVDGLEPVFDEEAIPFVIQLWRQLAFESTALTAGLDTGSMTI